MAGVQDAGKTPLPQPGRCTDPSYCAKRRRRIQEELVDIERLLDQLEVALQSGSASRWHNANGQIMVEGFELLCHHLNIILTKCHDLQADATDLEASDSGIWRLL
mmetsp:Transcript_10446/g.21141  ORF Transcript_10446/g.21141 Transcript_10446/m.21141 type:complete len:105 (-) Transcript_10446:41-355(-)